MSKATRSIASLGLRSLLIAALLAATGCVGGAWKKTLEEDTPAAYYRFMREHGDSEFSGEARERLDFHKLHRSPTVTGFEVFRKRYPESDLIEKLYPVLQKPAFEEAQARGTAAAYRGFLAGFARGDFAARAEGNAVFMEATGFGGDPRQLAIFAERYPLSDFAPEARRTVEAVAARQTGRIDRIGLVMEIAATTPEIKRVRDALVDRVMKMTERVGVELVAIPDRLDASQADRYPQARLEVSHIEQPVDHQVKAGELARPAVLGATRVVLREREGGAVIADRRFEIRVEDKAHVSGTSVLFSAVSPRFWDEFFVPIARWRNDRTVRPPTLLDRPVVDLDGFGDRIVVLYESGHFDLIGLSDPLEPVKLATYSRSENFKKWTGIRAIGERVAIYGEEGLELIRFTAKGPVVEKAWNRGEIGRVLSLAPLGDSIVLVGAKGMQLLDPVEGTVRRVMRRVLMSVAAVGDTVVFVDGESIYLSSMALLAENRVIAQMKLGKTFGPNNVRALDDAAVVTGPGGALVIDLRNPGQPKAVAKLSTREIGKVVDATRVRGRTFLVGERGLQLLNRRLDRVEETIDVGERNRVSVMGRHVVTADAQGIQVVDATPWSESPRPAAAGPRPGAPARGSGGF
ncbi:MAG: hypothetical protein GY910_10835 [bacterium]|nr:hypothetical protein [bacterium]